MWVGSRLWSFENKVLPILYYLHVKFLDVLQLGESGRGPGDDITESEGAERSAECGHQLGDQAVHPHTQAADLGCNLNCDLLGREFTRNLTCPHQTKYLSNFLLLLH